MQNKFRENLKISMFQHPDVGLFKGAEFNGAYREIFGVHHIKAAVFDNNVILTGANLNDSYYTNRTDRYWIIKDCEPFANYVDELISTSNLSHVPEIVSGCSYFINPDGELVMQTSFPTPNRKRQKYKEIFTHHLKFFQYRNKSEIPTNYDVDFADFFSEKADSQARPMADKGYEAKFAQKKDELATKEEENRDTFSVLGHEYVEHANALFSGDRRLQQIGGKVFIFPSLQIPAIKYREDEEVMRKVLEVAGEKCRLIRLASGYLSLPEAYLKALMNAKCSVELLAASPQANGFHKAGFFKKWIPIFYRCFEYALLKKLKGKDNIKLKEYAKPNWTYHAKGCWFYEAESHPSLCIIGSSNFCNPCRFTKNSTTINKPRYRMPVLFL